MSKDYNIYHPENHGWITTDLTTEKIEYLWKLIKTTNKQEKYRMTSQTDGCFQIFDEYEYFFQNVLLPTISAYEHNFGNNLRNIPVLNNVKMYMNGMWVNYQKQNEFFPIHTHNGIYSFVVWMKIPTNFEEQIKDRPKVDKVLFEGLYTSNFFFNYMNILGKNITYDFKMSSDLEGTLLLFPSSLQHGVYPFYKCDEERISVSGNICLK